MVAPLMTMAQPEQQLKAPPPPPSFPLLPPLFPLRLLPHEKLAWGRSFTKAAVLGR